MLLQYWKNQTGKEKIFLILALGFFIFGVYSAIKYELANRRLIKVQKQRLEVYEDSLEISKALLIDYISKGKEDNAAARRQSIVIDKKLKNDTEKINNTPVTDNELLQLLADYERKAGGK